MRLALESRFDWYEATLETFSDSASILATGLGAHISREPGRNGYSRCEAVVRDKDELVRVYSGSSRGDEVHAVITGESCEEVVPAFRRLFPVHRVSRADSALDFIADFEAVDRQALAFAKIRGLAFRLITDSDGGATRYLGASSSEVRVRVYKKSEQMRQAHPERASEVPDDVVRVELQARPNKSTVKAAVGNMEPDGLWGISRWTQDLGAELLSIDAERFSTHFRRPASWERALFYLGVQYGPVVRLRAEERGREALIAELVEAFGL